MSETGEPKIARKGVLLALGIICIVLVASLGGVVTAYTLVTDDKSNTISSLNLQISQLNSSVANLQSQVVSENSTIKSLTSQVTNLQKQLYPNTTYTAFGTLGYADVSAIFLGMNVASINPSFYPNLTGSFVYLTFNDQLTSTLPINAWTVGSMVAINGTISFDSYSQTCFLNWINGSLYNDTGEGVSQQSGLQLTMALQKNTYGLGEPVDITLTITNISNQTINYTYSDPNSYFRVYNDTNNDIYNVLETQVWPDFVALIQLNAGESLTDQRALLCLATDVQRHYGFGRHRCFARNVLHRWLW